MSIAPLYANRAAADRQPHNKRGRDGAAQQTRKKNFMSLLNKARFVLILALPLYAASCAVTTAPTPPLELLPPEFSASGRDPLPEKWWTALRDPQLDALIEKALGGNFNLRIAWNRLDQARALAEKSGAPLKPKLDGSAGAARLAAETRSPMGVETTTYWTDLSLGLMASYEVDLWGRIRSTFEAAQLDIEASEEDIRAAAITLSTQVAAVWNLLIENRGQLQLLDEQKKINENQLEIIILKFRRGLISAADVLQQKQLVEKTEGERVLVQSSTQVLTHQLAVLLGQAPGTLELAVPEKLPDLPDLPETGLPAEWIRQRPDIRAAERRIRSADRRVASAIADRFPRLSISLRTETSASKISDLFDNWLASLAANLTAPLFDGGMRRAEIDRTRAVVSERLNSYRQLVLASLLEVEDALARETHQGAYVASLRKQYDLSEKATAQTLENYTKGTMDFTRYLTTQLSHQNLQRSILRADSDLLQFRIDLYRALAGSWPLEKTETDTALDQDKTTQYPPDQADDAQKFQDAAPAI